MRMPRRFIILIVKIAIIEEIFCILYICLWSLHGFQFKNKGIPIFEVNERGNIVRFFSASI